jgi:hypothetical protein
MTIQHIELRGERYVIISERDFLELRGKRPESEDEPMSKPRPSNKRFRDVTPLQVDGTPASEILIRDRR